MADHKIQFTIGSIFKGEGFDKAVATTTKMNSAVRQGIASAAAMTQGLEGLDKGAAKAMTAMSGMLSSIMTFNVTAIVTQAGLMAINFYVSKMQEQAEEATKRMNELKSAVGRAFSSELQNQISSFETEVRSISTTFERITKQALAFTAALEGVRASNAAGGIAQLQVDKLNAMLEAHTEAERQNVEKSYDLLIAKARLTEAETAAGEKVAAATEEYEANKKRLSVIDEQMALAEQKRLELEQALIMLRASNSQRAADVQKEVDKLKQEEAELLQRRLETEAAGDVLSLKIEKAKSDGHAAILSATAAVRQAELSDRQLAEQNSKRAEAEARATAAALDKARADEEAAALRDEMRDAQLALNESSRELKTAQDQYAAALRQYEANFATNKLNEALFNSPVQTLGSAFGGVNTAALAKTMSSQAVNQALQEGKFNSVKDMERFQRYEERANRDRISEVSAQLGKEKQAYDRISQKSEMARSEKEKDFMQKYEKLRDSALKDKSDLDTAAANLDDAEEREKKMAEDIAEIAKRMKDLGLK